MNGINVNKPGAVAIPIDEGGEHYFTEMGGMASCPTAGIYAIPIHTGTPMEVAIGHGFGTSTHFEPAPQETLPSFDISKIVGLSIAETMAIAHSELTEYRCPFEHQATVLRLSMATYLAEASGAWEDTRLFLGRYQRTEDPVSDSRAARAFRDLAKCLGATNEELAGAIGVGRTTPYAWEREGREPRPATARRIHQLHAALSALRRKLGVGGLDTWLASGTPTRRDLIMTGELEALGADIDAELFTGASGPDLAAVVPDRGGVEPIPNANPPRPRRRKPRRTRLR